MIESDVVYVFFDETGNSRGYLDDAGQPYLLLTAAAEASIIEASGRKSTVYDSV